MLCNWQCPQQQPTYLGEDKQSAIKLSTNPVFHERSKRIDVKQHFLREAVQKIEISILHATTPQKMAANVFIKRLCETNITGHRENFMGRLNPNSGRV